MRNLFIGFLIVTAVLVGGGIVASVAYQAGVATAVTTAVAAAPAGTVVTPVAAVPYGYGWGWGHGGFPFFGIFAGLFFLFLLFALIRAATWRGRGWGGYGPGGTAAPADRVATANGATTTIVPASRRPSTSCIGSRTRALHRRTPAPDAGAASIAPSRHRPGGRLRVATMQPVTPTRTILVVDDEPRIVDLARDYLEHAGFRVIAATDGAMALETARRERPDLVVLDLGLPGLDGLDVTKALRADGSIPIVMVTARDDELDKLLGLELGADDYLTKPFSPRELVARVKAVLRRADRPPGDEDVIRVGELTLDVPRMRTEVAGTSVDLTPTEFTLLATLARQPGRIFTRSQLLDELRGVAFESYERAIDSHVKNLRRKIEPDPRQPRYVLTVYGVGYRLADDR